MHPRQMGQSNQHSLADASAIHHSTEQYNNGEHRAKAEDIQNGELDPPREKLRMTTSTPQLSAGVPHSGQRALDTVGALENIFIQRIGDQRLGLRVVGGLDTHLLAVFVEDITPHSAAANSNISIGDRLLAADGISLLAQPRSKVVDILLSAGTTLTLTVQHLGSNRWQAIKTEASQRIEKRAPQTFAIREIALPLYRSRPDPAPITTRGPVVQVVLGEDISNDVDEWIEISGGCGTELGAFFVTGVGKNTSALFRVGARVIDINSFSVVLAKARDLQQLIAGVRSPVRLTIQLVGMEQWNMIVGFTGFDPERDDSTRVILGHKTVVSDSSFVSSAQVKSNRTEPTSLFKEAKSVPSLTFPDPPPLPPTSSSVQRSSTVDRELSHRNHVSERAYNRKDIRDILLHRCEDGRFGLILLGPGDVARTDEAVEGVYVKEILGDSPLAAGIFIGDRILSINNQDVTQELVDSVLDRIAGLDSMSLTVENRPTALAMLEVEKQRSTNQRLVTIDEVDKYGLGIDVVEPPGILSINASIDVDRATGDPKNTPVYVAAIDSGGAVGQDGRVKVADQLVAIDGTRVRNAQHASNLLSHPRATIQFVVRASDEGFSAVQEIMHTSLVELELAGVMKAVQVDGEGKLGITLAGGTDTPLWGVFIKAVRPGSRAAIADLQTGDLIISLSGKGMLRRPHHEAVNMFLEVADHDTPEVIIMRLGRVQFKKYSAACTRSGLPATHLSICSLPLKMETVPSKGQMTRGSIFPICFSKMHAQDRVGIHLVGAFPNGIDAVFVGSIEDNSLCQGALEVGDRILEV